VDAERLLDFVWVIPALPALGAVVLLVAGRRIGEPKAGWLATLLMALSFLASIGAFFALQSLPGEQRRHVYELWDWFAGTGGFRVGFGFLADPLSITMILFVTGTATLIHLYAIGYMHGDPRFSRFFAYMNLFAASMLVLVLGSSFLVTFLGWEGVGLCSYLLISFWFERNSASVAGKKAFVTNRVGDFGFMLGMFLLFAHTGTLDYLPAFEAAPSLSQGTVTAIALLLFLGAMGKSAQVPLHVWLPDAMEGPTPVSALIHAATMVTAGVFLVSRAHVFFELGGAANDVVAWIGALTALGAATVAVRQNDIKRVLAYSTLSQLGYMFLAAGVGAYGAAIFHMVTHAFFKALLFLGAGSVIHGLHDEQDMRRMGALRKLMPVTAITFVVGWLAIAGVVPFAGFWSKDEILAKAWFSEAISGGKALWAVGLVAALLTAFYMTRQVRLVFFGRARWDSSGDHAVHPHESPPTMTFPLLVLAGLSLTGGLLSLPFTDPNLEFLAHWLEPSLDGAPHIEATSFGAGFLLSLAALGVGVVGIALGISLYRKGLEPDGTDPAERRLGPVAKVLEHAYYFDGAVGRVVAGPGAAFARLCAEGIDRRVIDGAVNGTARVFRELGGGLRRVQTGLVRNYALGIALGAVLLLGWFATRVNL
jgi:NADH-quinone oxidoreductase subunit L